MLFAAALAWGVVSSAGATSASYTNVVFSDGFESGSFGNWDFAPPGNGSATIVAAAAHSGTNGFRMTNAAGQFNLAIKTLPGPLTDSSVSFYMRPNTTSVQLVAQARDAASSSSTMWDLYYDGGQQRVLVLPAPGNHRQRDLHRGELRSGERLDQGRDPVHGDRHRRRADPPERADPDRLGRERRLHA